MDYPDDFIKVCKEMYPHSKELHEKLDSGDVFVGRYLCDACDRSISNVTVLKMVDNGNIRGLVDLAMTNIAKIDLYQQWGKLYDEQCG